MPSVMHDVDNDNIPAIVPVLYDAFAQRDVETLATALHPDFEGHVSTGMPLGVGGAHAGPEAMVTVWMQVFGDYDITPIPSEMWGGPTGEVVVHGWYRGTHRQTGAGVAAEFVHLLSVVEGRIRSLRQITDTAAWTPWLA